MALVQLKYRFLRHLMVSLALLWAVLLHGTACYAYGDPVTQSNPASTAQGESLSSELNSPGLQQGVLYLAEEGTASTLTISLQPAATASKASGIWFAGQKAIPPYAARAPGDNFFCQFFYTSSQPQAP
ncbi:hypothetical protein I0P70_11080 [Pontibacter sp. FD36]|uniref:hypothetical protein n=1 Tax=Pontibacter sp. FD36 TaxID=2789860 RepID=UPI0018ABBA2F|nr:hypothetical protein [Pontibacter sp. FD36]MBF8963794.1 hypothetical protein [Pontibacter sp. FD36]